MIKDIEFILKKIFFSESHLLKKRLSRAIKNNYEKELAIIEQFADKSKDALDVGVYRGVYSFKLSQNFKKVHAFEANPKLYPYIEKNLKKIIHNISLYNFALSDKNGETILKLPKRSKSIFKNNIEELFQLGAASIHPHKTFKEYVEIVTKMKKLDDIKINNKIGFIKIDVEGHELEVIKGASRTIKENKPILLVEIEERHSKRTLNESISIINNFGYKSFYVEGLNLIGFDNLKENVKNNNFYFLPK